MSVEYYLGVISRLEAQRDELKRERETSAWNEVTAALPAIDQIVWLYDAAQTLGPWLGGRADSGEGWIWCREYGLAWYDHPTHWMPLPFPPNNPKKKSP